MKVAKQFMGCLVVALSMVAGIGCKNAPNISYYVQPKGSLLGAGAHTKTGCFLGALDGRSIQITRHPVLTNLCVAKDRLIGWQLMGAPGQDHPGVRIFSLPGMNLLAEIPNAEVIAGGGDGLVIFYKEGFAIQQLDQLIQSRGAVKNLLPYPKEVGGNGVPACSGGGVVILSKGEGIVVCDAGSGKVLKNIDISDERYWPGRFEICGKDLFWVNITGESVLRMDLDSYKYRTVAEGSRVGIARMGDEVLLIKKGKLATLLCTQSSKQP